MSENSFDDQYEGCSQDMEEEVTSRLLQREKLRDREFATTWDSATRRWRRMRVIVPEGFREEYGVAIMVYSNYDRDVYKFFNKAVRDYSPTFPYHSLHFYLTRGLGLLGARCRTVYRGLTGVTFTAPTIGEHVRLGHFSSSSTNRTKAEEFGEDVLFTISSCYGVSIKDFSYYPEQEEVLVPVDEIFQVTNFTTGPEGQRFTLRAAKKRCHYYNCEYLQRGGRSNTCVASGGLRIQWFPALTFLLCFLVVTSS
ncbi:hypothetical protein GDO81_022892 [Engystomops pustulosus]|uniref:NAD(P)(+)--arginine ADP-ribosyltransferase n=1 Tax=Engystomops pustulosus TaxID=76066 RepID=A0AAV6YWF9_ENGPU|nr:hypothetical protein GDO81_022892 [Engystomops pustulosus]